MIGSNQKIAFQQSVLTAQDTGGNVETMQTIYETFANVRPTSSNRTFLHLEGMVIDSYFFDIQYTTEFLPNKTYTILYRGKQFAINGLTQVQEKRRMWRIYAIAET
jgi:SPP1 family predicted phage head-tail adaptor